MSLVYALYNQPNTSNLCSVYSNQDIKKHLVILYSGYKEKWKVEKFYIFLKLTTTQNINPKALLIS